MYDKKKKEKQLLKAIKNADESAFEEVYNQYYNPLCAFASTLVKENAEDIVQEVFISFWNKKNDLEINTSLQSYLYKSVYNSSLNFIKKLEKIKVDGTALTDSLLYSKITTIDLNDEVIDKIIGEEMQQKIVSIINDLPPQCKNIFVLSRDQELSYAEISTKLDISINTVKTQIKKALATLREKI